MVYKWCVVPQCTNTSIKSPLKLFVSVPTNPKRRKMWLQLARRDPKSIVSHSNVFMCEDHLDMEKDIINYMKYKMGFSQKLLLADEAVPTKFHCQEDCKRRLPGSSREVFLKRQRIDLVTECLQSHSATKTDAESVQKDYNMIQEIIDPEDVPAPETQETRAICRVCLVSGVGLRDIAAQGLKDVFEYLSKAKLKTKDRRPTTICYVCCSQLTRFRTFRELLHRSESVMSKITKKGLKISENTVSEQNSQLHTTPVLDVCAPSYTAIHTHENPNECILIEVKVESEEVDDHLGDNALNGEPGSEIDNAISEADILLKVEVDTDNEKDVDIECDIVDNKREDNTFSRVLDCDNEGSETELAIQLDEIIIQDENTLSAVFDWDNEKSETDEREMKYEIDIEEQKDPLEVIDTAVKNPQSCFKSSKVFLSEGDSQRHAPSQTEEPPCKRAKTKDLNS